jgi:cyclohexa-1,5-dienecarbonyl-CoA hydratase
VSVRTAVEVGIGRVVLNHPPLNILTRDVLARLREALDELAAEPDLRVLLLSAAGRHFSAGADVEEHLPPAYEELIPEFMETVAAVATFPLPVVAAVRGRCLGGGFEVAMAADRLGAGEGATFGQPEILLGVLPPAACVLLPRLCPAGVCAEIVFTGEAVGAREAERAGIVRRVVPDDELEEAAEAAARSIARHSAAALRVATRMLRGDGSELREALSRAGRMYVEELMSTGDAVEGLRAFLDKRRPAWSHR